MEEKEVLGKKFVVDKMSSPANTKFIGVCEPDGKTWHRVTEAVYRYIAPKKLPLNVSILSIDENTNSIAKLHIESEAQSNYSNNYTPKYSNEENTDRQLMIVRQSSLQRATELVIFKLANDEDEANKKLSLDEMSELVKLLAEDYVKFVMNK